MENLTAKTKEQSARDFKYDKIVSFDGTDYTVALLNGKAGLIDLDGNPLTEFIYDDLTDYYIGVYDSSSEGKLYSWTINENYCSLRLNGKWGLLDNKGKVIMDFEYGRIIEVYDVFDVHLVQTESQEILFDSNWNRIGRNSVGFYPLKSVFIYEQDNHYGLMSTTGKIITKAEYDYPIFEIKDQMFIVNSKNKEKIINIKGETVLKLSFRHHHSSDLSTCIIVENENKKQGVIDVKNNKIVIDFIYDVVKLCYDNNEIVKFVAMLNDKQALFNEEGVRIA